MGGSALPAGELAAIANIAPQTASGHLSKLLDGGLLSSEHQGRHRYYRLSSIEVADAIEALLVLTARPKSSRQAVWPPNATPGSIAYARTCYAHLAGWLGVQITRELELRGLLVATGRKNYVVPRSGQAWFRSLGIEVPSFDRTPEKFARRCLDWTERRHHVAGTLGCAMFRRFQDLKWVAPINSSRAVRVTLEGKRRLWEMLRIHVG
jgi:hypothetical protein